MPKYILQKKPVTTDHPKLGKIEFQVETPEAETLAEAITMCGGESDLVSFVNSQIATNAKNTARAYARTYDVAEGTDKDTFEAIKAQIAVKGQSLAKDYTPSADTERGPSKAKKAQAFDNIAALVQSGKEFTKEELFALLQQAS